MFAWIKVLGEVVGFARDLSDPIKKKAAYELIMEKNHNKALEIAEEIIHLVDDYNHSEISERRFKLRYNYLKRKFFKYD